MKWAEVHMVPKVVNLGGHKCYLYRMTALNAIRDIATSLGREVITEDLLLVVLNMVRGGRKVL